MFKLKSVLQAGSGAETLRQLTQTARGEPGRLMGAADLVEFGMCPRRWREAPDPEDPLGAYGPPMCEWVAWAESVGRRFYIPRPATYDALVLRCPKCGSSSAAASCKKCGVRRKNAVVPRQWSSAAHHCMSWETDAAARGLKPVPPRQWEAAQAGATRLTNDGPVLELKAGADLSRLLLGEYQSQPGALRIPVWAWVSIMPPWGGKFGQCLARVVETADADPAAWERTVLARGLHIEAALALALANAEESNTRNQYLWVVIEKQEPRLLARRRLSQESLQEGQERLEQLLATYAAAVGAERFPSYEPGEGELLEAWGPTDLADWLTGGQGADGGYRAPKLVAAAAA